MVANDYIGNNAYPTRRPPSVHSFASGHSNTSSRARQSKSKSRRRHTIQSRRAFSEQDAESIAASPHSQIQDLGSFKESETPFYCWPCRLDYRRKARLGNHLSAKHPDAKLKSTCNAPQGQSIIDFLWQKATRSSSRSRGKKETMDWIQLTDYVDLQPSTDPSNLGKRKSRKPSNKPGKSAIPLLCECGQNFLSHGNLKNHLRNCHPNACLKNGLQPPEGVSIADFIWNATNCEMADKTAYFIHLNEYLEISPSTQHDWRTHSAEPLPAPLYTGSTTEQPTSEFNLVQQLEVERLQGLRLDDHLGDHDVNSQTFDQYGRHDDTGSFYIQQEREGGIDMHQEAGSSNYLPGHAQHDSLYENYVNAVDPNQHDISSMMVAPTVDQDQDLLGVVQPHTTDLAWMGSHFY